MTEVCEFPIGHLVPELNRSKNSLLWKSAPIHALLDWERLAHKISVEFYILVHLRKMDPNPPLQFQYPRNVDHPYPVQTSAL